MTRTPVWMIIDACNWAHPLLHASGVDGAIRLLAQRAMWARGIPGIERVIWAMESPDGSSFRRKLWPAYKANRDQADPPGLSDVMSAIEEMAIAMGDDMASSPGFEADDMISTLANLAVQSERCAVIASADKDFRQCLVDGRVSILQEIRSGGNGPPRMQWLTARQMFESTDMRPDQWIDYQTMVGDATDNIKGCESIGPVAAREILTKCGSLDAYFGNRFATKITDKQHAKLVLYRSSGLLDTTRKLVTLRIDAPLPAGWLEEAA